MSARPRTKWRSDLADVHKRLKAIEKDAQAAKAKHNGFLKELGLPPLP